MKSLLNRSILTAYCMMLFVQFASGQKAESGSEIFGFILGISCYKTGGFLLRIEMISVDSPGKTGKFIKNRGG